MFKRLIRSIFPVKGDSRQEILLKIACIVLFCVVVASGGVLASHYLSSYRNSRLNSSLAAAYTSTPSSSPDSNQYPAGMLANFQTLYDRNPDVKGWLIIPGSKVDYPVAQSKDNDYYLNKSFDRADDSHGALFLDYRDLIKPMSENLIIYGHNMHDGSMFHSIINYQQIDTYKSAPAITFNTLYGNASWKVFACFVANCDPKDGYVFDYLKTDFSSDDDFNSYITEVKARSLLNIGVDVKPGDTLLTLSTCTYPEGLDNARFVVMARLARSGESLDAATVARNKNALAVTSPMK